jgi:hypothetical protein
MIETLASTAANGKVPSLTVGRVQSGVPNPNCRTDGSDASLPVQLSPLPCAVELCAKFGLFHRREQFRTGDWTSSRREMAGIPPVANP